MYPFVYTVTPSHGLMHALLRLRIEPLTSGHRSIHLPSVDSPDTHISHSNRFNRFISHRVINDGRRIVNFIYFLWFCLCIPSTSSSSFIDINPCESHFFPLCFSFSLISLASKHFNTKLSTQTMQCIYFSFLKTVSFSIINT